MREAKGRPRVLVVEDDSDISGLLVDVFVTEGYEAEAVNAAERVRGAVERKPDLVVLDLLLGGRYADAAVEALRERGHGDVPVLLLSGATDLAERAEALGAASYLPKPFELDDLLAVCRRLLDARRG